MKLIRKAAFKKHKHGVNIWVYNVSHKEAGLVYVESNAGHFQEFYDRRSTFIYYVLSGRGSFYLNGKKTSVKATDVVVAPPRTKIYYLGTMKLILVTVPAWRAKNEVHVRYIKR